MVLVVIQLDQYKVWWRDGCGEGLFYRFWAWTLNSIEGKL